MEVFLKVFLLIFMVNISAGAQVLLAVEKSDSKIPAYIRDLILDFHKKDPNIHDVAILNLENESSELILNQIIMEIPKENPLIIPQINLRLGDTRLRPTSFVIITSDIFDMIKLFNKGYKSFESNYCLNNAKFIFVGTKPMSETDIYLVALFFVYVGAFHVVILSERNDELLIRALNPYYPPNAIYSLNYNTDIDYVYPNKFLTLYGYTYKALAFSQKPRIYKLPNGEYSGIDVKFMQTVAEKQNAKFNITNYVDVSNDADFLSIYENSMFKKAVDITINTGILPTTTRTLKTFKPVNTFDVNGFCALVPYPPRTSFLGQMLTPYDFYTWILFVITIGTCVVIWKMFNLIGHGREDSALYFMYGVIAYFLLQSIPFRNNRIIQRSLLQICIFMMFILGNAYQSLIISLISESRYGATLKTFDELMQSNYSLKVDSIFYALMNSTDSKVIHKMHLINSNISSIDFTEEAANNSAFVLRCDMTEYILYAKEYNSNAIDYFYMLPDQIHTFYESFTTSRFSPFYEKLQHYSTLIFESGIRQYWKEFDKYEDIRENIETNKITNEEYLINFDDLFGVFYLLGFGFICAILALIFEIFWHDCLRHLNYEMIRELMTKKKEPKMIVKRIQVKPMERINEESV